MPKSPARTRASGSYRFPAGAASAQFPAWQSGGTYPIQGPVYSDSDAVFDTIYIEGGNGAYGFAHAPRATILGPDYGWTDYSPVFGKTGFFFYRGNGGRTDTPTYPAIGDGEYGALFPPGADNTYRHNLLRYSWANEGLYWNWQGPDLVFGFDAVGPTFNLTTNNSTRSFGAVAPARGIFTLYGFALNDETANAGDTATRERRFVLRQSGYPDAIGDFGAGMRVFAGSPVPGGIDHSVCVQAGAATKSAVGGRVLCGRLGGYRSRALLGADLPGSAVNSAQSNHAPNGASPYTDPDTGAVWTESLTRPAWQAIYLRTQATQAAYDPPSLAAGASTTFNINVPGARVGGIVQVVPSIDEGDLHIRGRVVDNNTVTVRYSNHTAAAIDMGGP